MDNNTRFINKFLNSTHTKSISLTGRQIMFIQKFDIILSKEVQTLIERKIKDKNITDEQLLEGLYD